MKPRIIALAVLLCTFAGCDYLPFGYTEIGDVVRNPALYEGKEIKIREAYRTWSRCRSSR